MDSTLFPLIFTALIQCVSMYLFNGFLQGMDIDINKYVPTNSEVFNYKRYYHSNGNMYQANGCQEGVAFLVSGLQQAHPPTQPYFRPAQKQQRQDKQHVYNMTPPLRSNLQGVKADRPRGGCKINRQTNKPIKQTLNQMLANEEAGETLESSQEHSANWSCWN